MNKIQIIINNNNNNNNNTRLVTSHMPMKIYYKYEAIETQASAYRILTKKGYQKKQSKKTSSVI